MLEEHMKEMDTEVNTEWRHFMLERNLQTRKIVFKHEINRRRSVYPFYKFSFIIK